MDTVYIGIDPTGGRRPINYVVLDGELHLLTRGLGKLEKVVEAVCAYPAAVVAVDAPQGLSAGLLASRARRRRHGLEADSTNWAGYKVSEYELRRRGMQVYNTPAEVEAAPAWMQLGFRLYAELKAAGFVQYPPAARRCVLEVYPYACYTVLLGHLPLRKDSLEGRMQRQLLLLQEGIDVPDPMRAFEEITRHHLLEGNLYLPTLLTHDELDALVSAYTAYLAVRRPDSVTLVGDPAEGQIVLPVPPGELKEIYR